MSAKTRLTAASVLFTLLALACGQKPGVHLSTGGGGGSGLEAVAGAEGELGIGEGGGAEGAAGGSAAGGGGTAGRRTSAAGGAGGGSGAGGPSGPGDSTGVSPTQIQVGFHAPATGAASVPLTDIQNGVNLLKDYLNEKGKKIHGREVITHFRDDQYSPSHAISVCRELVEQRKVFMLVGGAGTDQIQACARYAATKGVPYLSAGVTENELKSNRSYLAFSMTYPDQAKPLVSLIKNFNAPQGGPVLVDRCHDSGTACTDPFSGSPPPGSSAPKVAVVYSDTPGFHDARDAFVSQFQAAFGRQPDVIKPITKYTMSSNEATVLATDFKGQGIDVVYILTAPANWLEILNRANGQSYYPRWVGVGITKGINLVTDLACKRYPKAIQHSLFFSPWFSVHHPDAAQFGEVWRETGHLDDYRAHDLAYGVYGGSIVQAALLHAAGKNLTRQGFMAAAEKAQNLSFPSAAMGINIKDIFPPVSYSPNNHFGSSQVHLLWASCASQNPGDTGYWNYFQGAGHFASGF